MSYRFKNVGEKPNSQLVYEWISKNRIGFKFTYQQPAVDLDLPKDKWPNVSAALCYFTKQGAIKVCGSRMMVSPRGRKYPTAVYEFLKKIDRGDRKKPIDHTKNKVTKRVIVQVDPTEKRIKKLTNKLINISVEIESLMLELHKASK